MDRLVIKLNNTPEVVNYLIIEELATKARSASVTTLEGYLSVLKAYRDSVEYLMSNNSNLTINVLDSYYIKFLDSAVKEICKTNWGDSFGLTESQASSVSSIGAIFKGNTDIEYFDELKYFTNVTHLDYIGYWAEPQCAFNACTNLKSIDLTNVKIIDLRAFQGCTSLVEVKNFTGWQLAKLTYDCLFSGCPNLETINLSNLEIIVNSAFEDDVKLKNIGNLKSVRYMSEGSFCNTPALDIVLDMPKLGVNDSLIGDLSGWGYFRVLSWYAFTKSGIIGIKDLGYITTIENGTDYSNYHNPKWNMGCFSHCTSLRYAILPDTLTHIGSYCFYNTPALEWVKCLATVPPTLGNTDPSNNAFPFRNSTCNFYVPDAVVNDYKAATGWSSMASRIFSMSLFSTDFPND